MPATRKTSDKLSWLGLFLILPAVYLFQIVPHGHHFDDQDHSLEAAAPHAHHSHSHDHSDTDLPDESHHHHAVAQHLDDHCHRTHNRDLTTDRDLSFAVVPARPSPVLLTASQRPPERPEHPPDPEPVPTSRPRSPPLVG